MRPLTDLLYEEEPDKERLRQGDFIRRTDSINAMLASAQCPYTGPEYRGFLVVTQSCDLVPREDGKYGAKHICLAAVKRPSDAVAAELEHSQRNLERLGKFTTEQVRNRLSLFVERLLNNNAPGYFFLHEEQAVGVEEHLCALLSFTCAVDTEPYYDTCLLSRVTGLKDIFQAKLGWLVGTLYSRVGTKDLRDFSKESFDTLHKSLMSTSVMALRESDHDRLLRSLEKDPPPEVNPQVVKDRMGQLGLSKGSKKERFTRRLKEIVDERQQAVGITPGDLERLLPYVINDSELSSILR